MEQIFEITILKYLANFFMNFTSGLSLWNSSSWDI